MLKIEDEKHLQYKIMDIAKPLPWGRGIQNWIDYHRDFYFKEIGIDFAISFFSKYEYLLWSEQRFVLRKLGLDELNLFAFDCVNQCFIY